MTQDITILSANNNFVKIKNNPEDPIIQISYSRVGYNDQEKEKTHIAKIEIRIILKNGQIETNSAIYSNDKNINEKFSPSDFPEINNPNIDTVEIELVENNLLGFELELQIKKGRDLIEVKDPIKSFQEHLENGANTKILFSGPFGQGKTTFLDYFFNENHRGAYNVFTIFPVNYSVSSNEDIFKYIKTDILFQLLGADIEFEKSDISIKQAFSEYVYLNPKKTIVSFLKNISHLNSNVELLSKSIEALNHLIKPVLEYHQDESIDDRSSAEKYVKDIYDKEGSLFEDNFYTQLIRQLLEHLKGKSKKNNILIIEDLDRIDPDHIFRILNVISAHYDTYKSKTYSEHHNKFGFDKIIIVGDLRNIKNIFHHKFGIQTDFEGYINKYYSTSPFVYKNTDSINAFIYELYKKENQRNIENPFNKAHIILLNILVSENQLSLREILKLSTFDFEQFKQIDKQYELLFNKGSFSKSIAFLSNVYSAEELILKFSKIRDTISFQNNRFETECMFLLASLGVRKDGNKFSFYKDYTFILDIKYHWDYEVFENPSIKMIMDSNGNEINNPIDFNNVEFFNLLIENIKLYKEILKS